MQQDQPDHTPWYQPRTAEIIQRGGEGMANSIGQGLQQFGQGIAKGIYERQARKQKEEEDAKETKKQHNYYMGIGEMMGFDKTAMQNAGAEGTKGMVEGTIAKQKFEEFAGRIREQKMKEAATARDASAVAQFQRNYEQSTGTLPLGGPDLQVPGMERQNPAWNRAVTPDRFNLMQKSGVNPDDQYKLMRAYGEMGGAEGARADLGAIQYDPVPNIPGAVGWRRGNMAGIVQDPNVKADAYNRNRGQVTPALEYADAGRREKAAMDALKDPIIISNPELKAYWSTELGEARRAKKSASGDDSTSSAPPATSATNRFKIVELK